MTIPNPMREPGRHHRRAITSASTHILQNTSSESFSHGAKKSLGQNFLMHARIAERIVHEAGVIDTDTVLEIGPGTGMLTRALLAKAGKVIAVETDDDLIPVLKETFAEELSAGKLELVHGDIRAFDVSTLPAGYKVVANIPYYITGELIRQFLTASHKPSLLAFLVQKEVAVRVARAKKESILSLSVKVYGTPRYAFTVPRGAFRPAPNVDSAVLIIDSIHEAFSSKREEAYFFEIVKAGFAHKRKLLMGNLAVLKDVSALRNAFVAAELRDKARAEDVPLAAWRSLARSLAS